MVWLRTCCPVLYEKISFTRYIFLLVILSMSVSCSYKTPYYGSTLNQTDAGQRQFTLEQRVILVGDAGEPKACLKTEGIAREEICEPVLKLLKNWALKKPKKTFTVFLGDNVYPDGILKGVRKSCDGEDSNKCVCQINENDRDKAEEFPLSIQARVLSESGSSGVFVPGNHDWGGSEGPDYCVLENQFSLLEKMSAREWPGVYNLPLQAGCPGPVKIDLNGVRIIILDTQWWLTPNEPPENCKLESLKLATEKMRELLVSAGDREIIIATHHPLETHGPHGGFFTLKDHLFPLTKLHNALYIPLPILGSIYPLVRKYIYKSDQDLVGDKYIKMKKEISEMLKGNPPLIFASGHEHSLQVIRGLDTAQFFLVSGAGSESKVEPVGRNKESTLFAHEHTGFMVVDFLRNSTSQKVLLQVIEPGEQEIIYSTILKE